MFYHSRCDYKFFIILDIDIMQLLNFNNGFGRVSYLRLGFVNVNMHRFDSTILLLISTIAVSIRLDYIIYRYYFLVKMATFSVDDGKKSNGSNGFPNITETK